MFIPIFYKLRKFLPKNILEILYQSLLMSRIKYGLVSYGSNFKSNIQGLQSFQNRIIKIICNEKEGSTVEEMFKKLKFMNIYQLQLYGTIELYSRLHWNDINLENINVNLEIVKDVYIC